MFAEQMTVQMLDLMAEAAGGKLFIFHLKGIAKTILSAHTDGIRARDNAPLAGKTEAAFKSRLFTALSDNFGVDEF